MKFVKEVRDGTPITYLSDAKNQYSFGYYSNNNWVDENRIVLLRWSNGEKDAERIVNDTLVLIDLKNETETELVHEEKGIGISTVFGNKIYYLLGALVGTEVYSYDIETKVKKLIYKVDDDTVRLGLPHMTKDGRYLSWYIEYKNGQYGCLVIDLLTEKAEVPFTKSFLKPFNVANHFMICPTNKDIIFFSHEGSTEYITNRLWLYRKDKGIHALAKQRLDSEGNLIDCFGHECWAPDGKGLWFVKYPVSPEPPRGLCYVDIDGNQTDVVYGKYRYWHVCVSPNGKLLASDTQDEIYSGVCLINTETKEEKLLRKADVTWQHPCHPHPTFSPDSKTLCYHELYNDKITVGFINLENLI